jgi:hypothetical protein
MAHEINNAMGIIHARGSALMEAAAEKDSLPADLVLATI